LAPVRPGRSESRGPLPSPEFELPGSNGQGSKARSGQSQETRPLAEAGKLQLPFARQRTSGHQALSTRSGRPCLSPRATRRFRWFG